MPKKVLFVLTSHGRIESIDKPTGWFLPEFAHPYNELIKSNVEIDVASPKGGIAPLDPSSVETFKEDTESVEFYEKKKEIWENTKRLEEFKGKAAQFDAIFYPGGHGPMFDLVNDETSIKLIEEFYKAGKPIAAVCHGPAAFVNVKIDGKPILEGREVTGFSNAEEDAVVITTATPFILEDEIVRAGAKYVKSDQPWSEKVVVDKQNITGQLIITGQNPASAKAVGKAIKKAIGN